MTRIADNLRRILSTLPQGVKLVAVSKFHPAEALQAAYEAGQRIFGESRGAELKQKADSLPADIEWHFIGHLQTNKVKTVVPCASVIQSIDSERLLKAVDDECARLGLRIGVLLQVHVAREETKFGFLPQELLGIAPGLPERYPHVDILGVMGMASNTDDEHRIRADFQAIRQVFDDLRNGPMKDVAGFSTVSMGMSHDYELAVECGSNMVRIGTDIFGLREY